MWYTNSYLHKFRGSSLYKDSDLPVNMSSVPGELFILVDFNLHLDIPSSQAADLISILASIST